MLSCRLMVFYNKAPATKLDFSYVNGPGCAQYTDPAAAQLGGFMTSMPGYSTQSCQDRGYANGGGAVTGGMPGISHYTQ